MAYSNSTTGNIARQTGMVTCFDDLSAVMANFADDLNNRAKELRQVADNMNALCSQARQVAEHT